MPPILPVDVSHYPTIADAHFAVAVSAPSADTTASPHLGLRLKTLREAYGFSQRELAKRAGITNSNISMIEQEQVSPSVQSLARILTAFPMSLADFFAWDLTASGSYVYPAVTLHQDQRVTAAGAVIQSLAQNNSERQLDMQVQSLPAGFIGELTQAAGLQDFCGLVTQGCLTLLVGAQLHKLSVGDGFYIPRGVQFRFNNPTTALASFVSCSLFVRCV